MSKAWMAIYWGDYRQNTGHFNCTEHGAYMMLMAHYWENGGLPKPGRDFFPRLFNICACVSEVERRAVRYVVKTMFTKVRGYHVNKRLDQEIETAKKKRAERSRVGRMGGRPRKQKLLPWEAKGIQSQSQSQSYPDNKDMDRALRRRSMSKSKRCLYCNVGIYNSQNVCDKSDCIKAHQKDFLEGAARSVRPPSKTKRKRKVH